MATTDRAPKRVYRFALVSTSLAAALVVGCSGSDSSNGQSDTATLTGGATPLNSETGGFRSSGGTGNGIATSDTNSLTGGHTANSSSSAVGGQGGDTNSTGGAKQTGGFTASGGRSNTGGATSTGGTPATGGVKPTGGATLTGGATSTGGHTGSGGAASGGFKTTGGASNSGGTKSTGGAKATGGSAPTGGTKSTGGGTSTGCYAAPATQIGSQAPGGTVSGYGTVMIWAKTPRQIVRLQTTMVVPPKPPASGTLFLWPGLQPYGVNFDPIDNGVLQPVLTWGPACAPGVQPRAYSTWWISGQYVNTNGHVAGYTDCNGGPIISVNVCDTLDIDMVLSGTVWTQSITDEQTGQTVTYSIDMQAQSQNLAYFVIEEYSAAPVSEVIFTDTSITFDSPDATDCKVNTRGQTDYVSTPTASSDGLQCEIQQIILRAQGIK